MYSVKQKQLPKTKKKYKRVDLRSKMLKDTLWECTSTYINHKLQKHANAVTHTC